jgi:membrane-associated phospholipid phosphatase
MPQTSRLALWEEWQEAWQTTGFRRKVIFGLSVVVIIMCCFPIFFQTIEKRNGIALNDPILGWLPAYDVSKAIFVIIWSVSLLSLFRAIQHPYVFLTFVWAFILLSLMRMLTITLVPLDPPARLIGLVDPFSNFFYGEKFVTRDLFFSGHTSSVVLLCLCLPGKSDKRFALLAAVAVAFLLLVQHVHYTMDVLGAFLFAWIAYWVARRAILR